MEFAPLYFSHCVLRRNHLAEWEDDQRHPWTEMMHSALNLTFPPGKLHETESLYLTLPLPLSPEYPGYSHTQAHMADMILSGPCLMCLSLTPTSHFPRVTVMAFDSSEHDMASSHPAWREGNPYKINITHIYFTQGDRQGTTWPADTFTFNPHTAEQGKCKKKKKNWRKEDT